MIGLYEAMMENRRTPYNRSSTGRRHFNNDRSDASGGADRGNSPDGRKRFFKKRSPSSDAKMPPPRPGARPKTKKPWENVKRPKITSDLQVTDGRHLGILLENIEKINASVTTRKVREFMFRLLARKIRAARFLDICAGNGTIGIEAISRGAMLGTFVERSTRMGSCIRRNLEKCGVKPGNWELFEMEAVPFLRRMGNRRRYWDFVYCGTPCNSDFGSLLKCFGNGYSVRPGGIVVFEHPTEMEFPETVGLLKRKKVLGKEGVSMTIYERI